MAALTNLVQQETNHGFWIFMTHPSDNKKALYTPIMLFFLILNDLYLM